MNLQSSKSVSKMKANYSQAKIYCIKNTENNSIYIGTTINEIQHRFKDHQRAYKIWKADNQKPYCSSYEILKCNEASAELLENYPCKNKSDLLARQTHHIQTTNLDCVNKAQVITSPEERHEVEMRKAKTLREKRALKKKQEHEQWLASLNSNDVN